METQHTPPRSPEEMGQWASLYRYAQVGRCVNGVAHDINNLLGAVLAYPELVQMEHGLTENGQRMLENVLEAAEKCAALVSALTAVARPERDSRDMVDLGALLRDMALLRDYAFRSSRIQFELSLPSAAPSVLVDGPRLRWAVLYLLLHAEDAVMGADDSQRRVRLSLTSGASGPAIAVWHALMECDGASQPEGPAAADAGIGVLLARQLVEDMGGSLAVTPQEGLVITLPGVSS